MGGAPVPQCRGKSLDCARHDFFWGPVLTAGEQGDEQRVEGCVVNRLGPARHGVREQAAAAIVKERCKRRACSAAPA